MAANLLLLSYIGPETILPAASALAAAGGIILMFGRSVRRFFAWGVRLVVRR